jgi:beta-galactosidase
LTDGSTGRVWPECGQATTATVVASYADGPVEGRPAITRRAVGSGSVWYVGTRLSDASLPQLLAGWSPPSAAPLGIEAVRRRHPDGRSYLFLLNHSDSPVTVPADGIELLTGAQWTDKAALPAGGVAVIAEEVG